MRVDVSKSAYHEDPAARRQFNATELKRLRIILRRLRFLEAQVRKTGGLASDSGSGGAAFAEWEVEALEWLLYEEVGFILKPKVPEPVSGNPT